MQAPISGLLLRLAMPESARKALNPWPCVLATGAPQGGKGGEPRTVEWRQIGEGVMMVSILHDGRLYKGALTVQVSVQGLQWGALLSAMGREK